MKSYLTSSVIGPYAVALRDRYRMVSTSLCRPQEVGALANRQLAYRLIVELCEKQKELIDVGAHIGLFAMLARKQNPDAKFVGIEAMPDKVATLRKGFPDVEFHECAVGNEKGKAVFNIYPNRDGFSSLNNFLDAEDEQAIQIETEVRTLDDMFADRDVDAIKLIIEGGELNALRGAEQLLTKTRPIIMFESSHFEDPQDGNTIADRWRFLNERDYLIVLPERVAHDAVELSMEVFKDSHHYPWRTLYYLAIPAERRDEIRQKSRKILGVG